MYPQIGTASTLKLAKLQNRNSIHVCCYPTPLNEKKKNHTSHKPSKSTTIHPATPSTPSLQPTQGINQSKPQSQKRGAATAQSPRSNQAPQTALSPSL
ncbi:hypothetical protein M431DRAFT_511284 [Trichoderma harzianum CBS 226.95]|uniref:Uncharacterized protein n=1 Tax=Trichoderma harzianum CBS 226.95 TaxID=983964 RepID=A0A2T4A261_TRIHA|nr:hypothetical protein M431DRAFT_511284 [Trichoderma harzianum CBS 226.95]PTB51161.1 hypothetical protein M431DRAFT_511284 [Trichoderma harzianum CBS 226.95]